MFSEVLSDNDGQIVGSRFYWITRSRIRHVCTEVIRYDRRACTFHTNDHLIRIYYS